MARSRRKSRGSSGANKKLPLNQSIPLGIQHVFAMFAGNITVPLIVAGVFGVTTAEKIFLIQMALFAAGVATIIQTVGYNSNYYSYYNCMSQTKSNTITQKGADHGAAQCKFFF